MVLVSSDSAFHGIFYVKHERIICHEAAEHRAKNGSTVKHYLKSDRST